MKLKPFCLVRVLPSDPRLFIILTGVVLILAAAIPLSWAQALSPSCSGVFGSQVPGRFAQIRPLTSPVAFLPMPSDQLILFAGQITTEPGKIQVQAKGRDLEFRVSSSNDGLGSTETMSSAMATIHFKGHEGELPALDPALGPELARALFPIVDGDPRSQMDRIFDPVGLQVIQENRGDFFAVQFVARANQSRKVSVILETDRSQELSRQRGAPVFYQADFTTNQKESYVTLPLSQFHLVGEGQPDLQKALPDIESLPGHSEHLVLKSFSFRFQNETQPRVSTADPNDFRMSVHLGEIGFGFAFGLNYEKTRKVLKRAASLYREVFNTLEGLRRLDSGEELGFFRYDKRVSLGFMSSFAANIEKVIQMLDQMQETFLNKQQRRFDPTLTMHARQKILNAEIRAAFKQKNSAREPLRSEGHFLGKVPLVEVWAEVVRNSRLPIETGLFGEIHGEDAHAKQFLEMIKNASDQQQDALADVLKETTTFNFFWNLIFEGRAGGITDPSTHRDP